MNGYSQIKPHAWITTNEFFLAGDNSHIVKVHRPKVRHKPFYKYKALSFFGRPLPFEFRSEAERCAHEKEVLRCWASYGLPVPKLIYDLEFPERRDIWLALEYSNGRDMAAYLRDETIDRAERLQAATELIQRCNARHARAFSNHERWLIKYDGNLRNVLVTETGIKHVDFECGRVHESLERGAQREITRYTIEFVRAIGRDSAREVVDLIEQHYRHGSILRSIKKQKSGRITGEFEVCDFAMLLNVA